MIVHLQGCGEGFGLCTKHKSWLGNIRLINIHSLFYSPRYEGKHRKSWSQCRGTNGQTLLGHVTRRALGIHLLAGKGQRGRGQCPATWNSLPGLANCGGGVDGLTGIQTTQDNKGLGCALEQMQSAAPCRARSTAVTDQSAGVIPTLRGAGATFLLPKCRQLRRAAAELMHLTKYYLATGISAFTPESLW